MNIKLSAALALALLTAVTPVAAQDDDNPPGEILDVLTWGQPPLVTVTMGSQAAQASPSAAPAMAAGPLSGSWFAGAVFGWNLEREAFAIGVEFGRAFVDRSWGHVFLDGQLTRTSANNGTHWGFQPGIGLIPWANDEQRELLFRIVGSVLANRFTSDSFSGTDFGAALELGAMYGFSERTQAVFGLAVQQAGGLTQFLVKLQWLYVAP